MSDWLEAALAQQQHETDLALQETAATVEVVATESEVLLAEVVSNDQIDIQQLWKLYLAI